MLVASLRFPGGLRVEQHDCSVCSPYSSSSTVPECGETSVFRLEVILGGAKSYSNVVGGLLIRSVLNIGLGTTRKPGKHSGYSCAFFGPLLHVLESYLGGRVHVLALYR